MKKNIPLLVLSALVLAGTLIFRIRFLSAPLDRDEGEFAYAGWRMLHDGIPYLDFYNMKMPGIYAAYFFLFKIFGTSVEAIRTGLILVNLCNTFFVFHLTKKICESDRSENKISSLATAVTAALCYMIFSVQTELQGTSAHAEHFAMFFALPAFFLLLKAREKNSTLLFSISGLLSGVAFLMKQPALAFTAMMLLFICVDAMRLKRWKNFIRSIASFLAAAMVPLGITTLFLLSKDAGSNFRLFAFEYAHEYISYLTVNDGWINCISALRKAVPQNIVLWLPAVLFLFLIARKRSFAFTSTFIFFIFSFLATSAGLYFRPHYFQFMIPAVAMMSAIALNQFSNVSSEKPNTGQFILCSYLILAVCFFAYADRKIFSIRNNDDFIREVYGLDYFNAAKKTSAFIAEHSKPDSRIAIFGAEPEVWFYSKRIAASGYLYVYPLLENHKFAAQMRQQFYKEIQESKPDILLYTSNEGTWYANENIHQEIYNWYKAYRDSRFKRIGIVDMPFDGPTAYHWSEDTTLQPANPENYFEIFQRLDGRH